MRILGAIGFVLLQCRPNPPYMSHSVTRCFFAKNMVQKGRLEDDDESSLGDLTGGLETTTQYLPEFSPMERIVLTANGNLQRLISSYYNSPVIVECIESKEVGDGVFHRVVYLSVLLNGPQQPTRFCRATSTIIVRSDSIKRAISSGVVGVGQLFTRYRILPEFRLLDAGRDDSEGGFYRLYELRSNRPEIKCIIKEVFAPEMFAFTDVGGDT